MKIEVKQMKENHLLNRTEVKFEIEHSKTSTPARKDVLELLATKTNRDKKLIAILDIKTVYGDNISRGSAHIYSDEKAMKVEQDYLFKRGQKKEKKEETVDAHASAPAEKPTAK